MSDPKLCAYNAERDSFLGGEFPREFRWSLATAAYQIEGGAHQDGKSDNIWDVWSHGSTNGSCNVDQCQNGDVACDSYNQMDRDLANIIAMGVKNYRFSFSWARLLPCGKQTCINNRAVEHYSKWIDMLIASDITPFVTLYHWDLPQVLHEAYGGWISDQIIHDFSDYSRLCFKLFGDRVKFWITINEPSEVADEGYGTATMAPGIYGPNTTQWIARHNTVRAHTAAWHIYDTEFRSSQHGRVGITLNTDWIEPITENDVYASRVDWAFTLGYWAEPIYLTGDYPQEVKQTLANLNISLPVFNTTEIKRNLGSSDFFGVNHYTTSLVSACSIGTKDCDFGFYESVCSNWPTAGSSWLSSNPYG